MIHGGNTHILHHRHRALLLFSDFQHIHGPLGWKTVDEIAGNHLGREIGQAESGQIASSEDRERQSLPRIPPDQGLFIEKRLPRVNRRLSFCCNIRPHSLPFGLIHSCLDTLKLIAERLYRTLVFLKLYFNE